VLSAVLQAGETLLRAGAPPLDEGLSEWYAGLNLACPFLSDRACTIYSQRPMACREFLVAGDPTACAAGMAEPIDSSVSVASVFSDLSGELFGDDARAIPLPLAIPWAADHLELDARTHDLADLLAQLDSRLADAARAAELAKTA
jgi:hypothetical protein